MPRNRKDDKLIRSALLRYFREVVTIRKEEMRSAKELVMDVIDILQDEFQEDETDVNLKLEVGDPIFSGSVWEGLKTEDASEFDVVFPLILDGDAWDCNKLTDDSTNYGPYICFLKNGYYSKEDARILRLYGDKKLMDKTLDPMRVKKAFSKEVFNILKAKDDELDEIMWEEADTPETSPAVTLVVYNNDTPDRRISLDLVPCLEIEKPNDDVVLLAPKGDDRLWRRSFSLQEKKLLKSIDRRDNGCRKKVIRILKTVSSKSRHTPLAYLDSYTLKNAVMQLHQSGDWSEENIAGSFKRVLRYLEVCFQKGELPRYFEKKHNILKNKEPVVLENIAGFLRNIRESNDYISLLGSGPVPRHRRTPCFSRQPIRPLARMGRFPDSRFLDGPHSRKAFNPNRPFFSNSPLERMGCFPDVRHFRQRMGHFPPQPSSRRTTFPKSHPFPNHIIRPGRVRSRGYCID